MKFSEYSYVELRNCDSEVYNSDWTGMGSVMFGIAGLQLNLGKR